MVRKHGIQKREEFVKPIQFCKCSPQGSFLNLHVLFFSVRTNSATCTETEAWNIPESFWYKSPDVDLKTVGDGVIIDQDSSYSKSLEWEYDGRRIGDNICLCKSWEAAYSLKEPAVWNGSDCQIDTRSFQCPKSPETMTTMAYSDIFGNSPLPMEKWFWFSARQIGTTTNNFVSKALPGLKLCLRPRVYMDYNINPGKIVFFRGTALIKVSWDESKYDTSRCGEKQSVTFISRDSFGNRQTEYNTQNGMTIAFYRNSNPPSYYNFALGMGISSINNYTQVTRCLVLTATE